MAADGRLDADRRERTETEYLLMVDFLGRSGIWGSEKRMLGVVSEKAVLVAANEALKHAGRVEVFSREVPVEWTKVEELRHAW